MRNSSVRLLVYLVAGLTFAGCKKQLNVFPTSSEVDGNVITDQQSAQTVLNGVYYRFANAHIDGYTNTPYTGWATVNEFIPSELAGSLIYYAGYDPIEQLTMTPSTWHVDSIWYYGYALVNAANGFIKNAAPSAGIPAAAKREMLAEARFLRAFGNSQLLFYYGQYNDTANKDSIILRDTFVTSANVNLPRSGVGAAYTAILADLDSAIAGLPALNSAIYYANAWDAKLLKARVLMNRGQGDDYVQVTSLTKDIIANGPFVLEDSVKAIFLTNGLNSNEVMLGIQPYPNESFKFQQYVYVAYFLATDSLASLLGDDARNQWTFQYTYSNQNYDSVNLVTKYYPGDPANPVQTPLSDNCYAFRLTEAYLLEAEAIALSGGDLANAKGLLTTVMSHAGAGATEMAAVSAAGTPGALQVEIVKENMRNFAFENGVDWLAFRRLPFATMQQLNPNVQDAHYLILPIPIEETLYNNVIQNPGY